ncbi:hypothetical protein [Rhodococcus sp. Leaf278]|uniref:hypothetical protein n=1 Tax=Rhodococcus sp. Leaf278 TaxID=1736319 RepID=UPI000AF0FE36|nr:hypothetical protein [Rhodococcus sp. Leaf278]
MDDADFDVAVRAELTSLDGIRTYLADNPGRRAAPESDLAEDEDRLPHIWATTIAQRALLHACECIEAASALMVNWSWSFAQFALLRAAYESAGSTVWLLIPEESDLRLARLLAQHNDSWKYSAKAYTGTPLDDSGEHRERQQWTTDIAAEINIDLANGRSGGYENLIASIDDLPNEPGSLLTAWRVCSGVSHAKTWAMLTVTSEIESGDLYEHGRVSGRVPNLELFLAHLRVARRTVQHAWVYYQIRTTPRPHSITLKLEFGPADNGDHICNGDNDAGQVKRAETSA